MLYPMEPLDAHGHAMDFFDRTVHKIQPDDWRLPTPCTKWSVRDLVNHLVYEQLWVPEMVAGKTVEEVGDRYDGDLLGDDPLRRWTETARLARQAWLKPGALDGVAHLNRGATPAVNYCWEMTFDLAVHGWDLATAIGADESIGDELATKLLEVFEPQFDSWQGLGFFDPPVPVPDDADPQTKLVALSGRRP
jgi:uncharacterized protein (TIGR03086 family)